MRTWLEDQDPPLFPVALDEAGDRLQRELSIQRVGTKYYDNVNHDDGLAWLAKYAGAERIICYLEHGSMELGDLVDEAAAAMLDRGDA